MTESQVDRAGAAGAAPDIAPLLEPVRIGRLWLRNRFVMPGMQRFGCVDGAPSERLREYYRRRALGGTALVIAEACAVDHPSSASNGVFARIDARTRDAWRACVDAVHDVGGPMFLQLWHAGAVDTGGTDIAADFIVLGRSLIGDPDWVAKMRDGRGAQIRPFRRADLEWLSALARRAA